MFIQYLTICRNDPRVCYFSTLANSHYDGLKVFHTLINQVYFTDRHCSQIPFVTEDESASLNEVF